MNTIAHFVYEYLPLSETFIHDQIKNLCGCKVVVLTTKTKNMRVFPAKNIYSLDGLGLPAKIIEKFSFKFFGRSALFENILKDISLVHAHFGNAASKFVKIKKKSDVAMITSFYGHDCYCYPLNKSNAYKELFAAGELFLALGKNMARELNSLGCKNEKVMVHHLGVDIPKIRKKYHDDRVIFLIVARFIEKKGIEYAIKAFSVLTKDYRNIELRIVGDGPMRNTLLQLSKELGSGRITFINNFSSHDPRRVVMDEYANADIFLLPSVTGKNGDKEGTPITLMEAQAFGLPCISTVHSDIGEVVIDNKTGFLVPERDSVAVMEKMAYLTEDMKKRRIFGRNGTKHIKKEFNSEIQARKLRSIYKSVVPNI